MMNKLDETVLSIFLLTSIHDCDEIFSKMYVEVVPINNNFVSQIWQTNFYEFPKTLYNLWADNRFRIVMNRKVLSKLETLIYTKYVAVTKFLLKLHTIGTPYNINY